MANEEEGGKDWFRATKSSEFVEEGIQDNKKDDK